MPSEAIQAKALECEQKALATQDVILVRLYIGLAHQWRKVAEQIEREQTPVQLVAEDDRAIVSVRSAEATSD
jgi:hypothetical protein